MESERKKFFGLDVNAKSTPYKLLGLVVLLWGGCWGIVPLIYSPPDGSGTFGDMFGVVNALFSGLAFVGLIYTILLQREDLKLTQDELRGQKEELKTQNGTLKLQRFESTFFNLVNAHLTLLNSEMTNRSVLNAILVRLRKRLLHMEIGRKLDKVSYLDVRKVYHETIEDIDNALFLFAGSISSLLHFVSKSNLIDDDDRIYYFSLLRSYISKEEGTLLYYYLSLEDRLLFTYRDDLLAIEAKWEFFTLLQRDFFHESHSELAKAWDWLWMKENDLL